MFSGDGALNNIAQAASHFAVGCASGAIANGSCTGGGLGAVTAEFAAEYAHDTLGYSKENAKKFGEYSSVVAGILSNDGAEGITAAYQAGTTAVENNFWAHNLEHKEIETVTLVEATRNLGKVVNEGGAYLYQKAEDGTYYMYELSPEAVSAVGKGLDIPANGIKFVGRTVSNGVDFLAGQDNYIQGKAADLDGWLNDYGVDPDLRTGIAVLAAPVLGAAGKKLLGAADGLVPNKIINKIVSTPKGLRPDPTTYMTASQIESHLALFDEGAVRFFTPSQGGAIGPKDAFVFPKSYLDDLYSSTGGNIRAIENQLGLPSGYLDNAQAAIINNPNVKIPSGNERGVNDLWQPGGYTSGGVPEAVIPGQISVDDVIVKPVGELFNGN